jgi:NAD(P)-dependent dehydrogenase (short-subunit alcohol dehydrogenase family)
MQKGAKKRSIRPAQKQNKQPGMESLMEPKPQFEKPRPIWTPLIPASFPPKDVSTFGSDVPMCRAGQPGEVAPCYAFLASDDSSYTTGQVLHPNGGEIVNG